MVEDATEEAARTARRLAGSGLVIIDTPTFVSTTLHRLGGGDFLLVPVKPSPFDVDRMLDTLSILTDRANGRPPPFRCVLTQTTRDLIIARQIRLELADAGLPVLQSEMMNRVGYPEAALWGDAKPDQLEGTCRAADCRHRRGGRHGARGTKGGRMTRKQLPRAIRRTDAPTPRNRRRRHPRRSGSSCRDEA